MLRDETRPIEMQAVAPHVGARLHLPSLGLRASERILLLHLVDIAVLVAALISAIRLRTDWMDPPGAFFALWRWYVTLAIVWWIVAQLLEAYDLARAASAPHSMLTVVGAAALTVLIYQFIPRFTPPLASRGLVLLFALFAMMGLAVWRGLYAVLVVQPAFQRRVLIFGAGQSGRELAAALASEGRTPHPYHSAGYNVIGFVDDDPTKREQVIVRGISVLGGSVDLPRLAAQLSVDEIVLAITHRHTMTPEAFTAVLECREKGFRVTTMPTLYERVLGRVPVNHAGRNIAAVLPVDEPGAADRIYALIKSGTDYLVATLALIPLGLVIPLVALANALTSPGPLFYQQTRVGRRGRLFRVIKFRTMRPDAEQACGAIWATDHDPRVTPIGRFLRRVRLDELPQVLNILCGEMSWIGPRPERPEFTEELARQIPFYRVRHAVRPGLTGWAQVRFGYGNTIEDARIKLEYDLYYVRHSGFYLDALIVLKTAAVVLRSQGK